MERTRFITHRDTRILVVDFSGIEELDELAREGERVSLVIRAEPPDSLRLLIDFTGVPYNLRVVRVLAEIAEGNADHVRARAMVGIPQTALPSVRAVSEYTRRPAEAFADRDAALEWLVLQ
ncbi:MAG: hypothetical protein JO040_05750 [Gemmatimonadetes bacterium]|nr:hypothetical protein [Gemmatimonadota bacterium]